MTAARKPADPRRRSLLAKVHVAKAQLGIPDDAYRAMIARHGKGKESAAALGDAQLVAVIEELKAKGWKDAKRPPKRAGRVRPTVNDPQAKARALWIAAWHLGVVADSSEEALAAFVRRQAKVDALQWLHPDAAPKVIEGLKAMMARKAGVDWSGYRFFGAPPQYRPKARILEAQWRILCAAGRMHRPGAEGLCAWLELAAGVRLPDGGGEFRHVFAADEAELDRAIALLGKHVREAADG